MSSKPPDHDPGYSPPAQGTRHSGAGGAATRQDRRLSRVFCSGLPHRGRSGTESRLGRVEELLKTEGVAVVDVIQPMWDAKTRTNELLFLKTDSHLDPSGLAVAADVIAVRANEILGEATLPHLSQNPFSSVTEPASLCNAHLCPAINERCSI